MTPTQSLALAALTAVIGVAVGWQLRPGSELTPDALRKSPAKSAEAIIEKQADTSALARLRDQLAAERAARAELEAQVDALQAQVTDLTLRAQRYDLMREYLIKNPLWMLTKLQLSPNNLEMSDELIQVLAIDQVQVEQINAIGQDLTNRIKKWEKEKAVTVKQSDRITTILPPYPEDLKEQFHEALTRIVPEKDASLISSMGQGFFSYLQYPRQINATVTIDELDRELIELEIFKRGTEGQLEEFSSGAYGGYIPSRWSHLFQLEDAPE